ncbi:helix-turn-helix transcriptional regulator [Clostridium sp.]|uniref:helix-turn-helix domain-containing protein n=1 Tax=Clostridium sp. TaxID=1506 RepID=UPI003217723E
MFNKENVENLMNEKGWTKYRLAKEANLGQSTVHEIMSGKKKTPTSTTLQKLADALGVTVSAFFDNETTENALVKEDKKIEPEKQKQIRTVAAHLEDKDLTPKKLKLLNDYIDALFDDDEW